MVARRRFNFSGQFVRQVLASLLRRHQILMRHSVGPVVLGNLEILVENVNPAFAQFRDIVKESRLNAAAAAFCEAGMDNDAAGASFGIGRLDFSHRALSRPRGQ
jgi:hypothetical protein